VGVLKKNFRRTILREVKKNLRLMRFFLKFPPNRHPERSASQICHVKQRFMARSRRTPRMLI
jgi:hypothetical protein